MRNVIFLLSILSCHIFMSCGNKNSSDNSIPPAFPCEKLTQNLIKNEWVLVDLRVYENDESLYPCLLDSVICFTDSAVEYSSGFYVNNEKKIFADYQITGNQLSIKKSETLIHHFKIDKLSDDSLVLTDSVDGYTFQFKISDQNESRLDLVALTYSVKDLCDFPDICPNVYQIQLDSGMNFYLSDDNEGEISSGISKEKYQYFMHRIAQVDWQKMADTLGIFQFPRTIEVVQIEYISNNTLNKANVTINSESCPIMLRMLLNGLKDYKCQLLKNSTL